MGSYVIAKYIRLSMEDAKSDSMSIETQSEIIDKHICDLGLSDSTVLEFVDNGHSGANFERPAVQRLLGLVQEGIIDCIAVKDFSRFGRNAIETGYFIERIFPLYGTRFIAVTDDFDSDEHEGHTGGIEVAFKFLMHEHYSRDISKKIKAAKYGKMMRGELVSKNCVFGYKSNDERKMVIDEPAAETVRLIFSMAHEGKSLVEIERRLYEEKRPTPSEYKKAERGENAGEFSCMWSKPGVWGILNEEQYIGTYIAGRQKILEVGSRTQKKMDESQWIKIPNHHPAIIEPAVFDAVRSSRKNKPEPIRKRELGTWQRYTGNPVSPLKGKVYCGCCGKAMTPSSTRNVAFHCRFTSALPDAACYRLRVLAADLEAVVHDIVNTQLQVYLDADFECVERLAAKSEQQARQEKLIANAEDEKRRLYEKLVLGEVCPDEYKAGKAEVDAKLANLIRVHEMLAKETVALAISKQNRDELSAAAEIHTESGLTRPLVEILIDRVLVFPGDRVDIVWKISEFVAAR